MRHVSVQVNLNRSWRSSSRWHSHTLPSGRSPKWSCDAGLAHVTHNYVSLSGESGTSNKLDILSIRCERSGPFWSTSQAQIQHSFISVSFPKHAHVCWFEDIHNIQSSIKHVCTCVWSRLHAKLSEPQPFYPHEENLRIFLQTKLLIHSWACSSPPSCSLLSSPSLRSSLGSCKLHNRPFICGGVRP